MKRIVECLLILFFSTACAMVYNYFSPVGIALVGSWDKEKGVISAGSKDNPVVHEIEIDNVAAVKEIYDAGDVVFIDARPEEDFNEGHIPGAVSMPVFSFEDYIETFYNTHPTATHIITYCSGRECQDSHELAQLLIDIGYSHVNVFIDGFPAWQEQGFPVESIGGGA